MHLFLEDLIQHYRNKLFVVPGVHLVFKTLFKIIKNKRTLYLKITKNGKRNYSAWVWYF